MKYLSKKPKGAIKVASMVINGPGLMNKRQRKNIAKWLRNQAYGIEANGALYTKGRYTAEYSYLKS